MKWYSEPFVIKDKREVAKGIYTNHYLMHDETYLKDGVEKVSIRGEYVPKEVFDKVKVGYNVSLERTTFYNTKEKKEYDFVSDVRAVK